MAHTTFRNEGDPIWKDQGKGGKGPQGDPMHGEGKSQARDHGEKKPTTPTKDHPALKGNTTKG
jgi:hypothetical protein